MLDPSTRQVSDVKHTVAAAASSSSASRAKHFLETCKCPSSAAAYGSYGELVKDKNVDIIYVAMPHSHHYQNTMLCLLNGKHVLCEKAFTVNAAQAKKLAETAKEKKLFLMEAVWTRFFPLSIQIRKMIEDRELGAVHRVIADLSFGEDVKNTWGANGAKHRMVNNGPGRWSSAGSRNLPPNMVFPNPLPHRPRLVPETSLHHRLSRTIRNRR